MMAYLLDTHVIIWASIAPTKLNQKCMDILTNFDNQVFFSAASIWEVAINSHALNLTIQMQSWNN